MGSQRRKVSQSIEAEALEEVAGGLIQDGASLVLDPILIDEATSDKRLHNGLNVNATNG